MITKSGYMTSVTSQPLYTNVCDCQLKCVLETDNSVISSGMFPRVSSFALNSWTVLFLSDTFSIEAIIPIRSYRSEIAVTLVMSRSKDAFNDVTANSNLGVTILSKAVEIALWILSPTKSTMLPFSLSILSLKYLSNIGIFLVFSLVVAILLLILTENSRSMATSLWGGGSHKTYGRTDVYSAHWSLES